MASGVCYFFPTQGKIVGSTVRSSEHFILYHNSWGYNYHIIHFLPFLSLIFLLHVINVLAVRFSISPLVFLYFFLSIPFSRTNLIILSTSCNHFSLVLSVIPSMSLTWTIRCVPIRCLLEPHQLKFSQFRRRLRQCCHRLKLFPSATRCIVIVSVPNEGNDIKILSSCCANYLV